MINAIGPSGLARAIEASRADRVTGPAAPAKVAASMPGDVAIASPAAELAAQGVPIDDAKVAAIRAQIAAGTYRVDPEAIAAKMIATDLPKGR